MIECPECRKAVHIQQTEHGLTGVAANVPHPSDAELFPKGFRVQKPVWIAGGLGLLILVLVLVPLLSRRLPKGTPDEGESPLAATGSNVAPPETVPPGDLPEQPSDPVEAKLQEIFLMIQQAPSQGDPTAEQAMIREDSGRSWIAGLAERHLPGRQAQWDLGWNAPVNDEFVRRRFPAFENPLVSAKSGDDNYPASHFVGVSGVGGDAAELERTHPRAGIFSTRRKTTPGDVTDGLSNTMLVAGVESGLGSWARPGTATMRSFSQEPYLHGPDGFGTGQGDRMLVLMADGSVKEVSSKIDPVIVRRMAAMADGFSLDPQVAGDPLSPQQLPDQTPAAPEITPGVAMPADPIPEPVEMEIPPIDWAARLEQKIKLFEQVKPVPLVALLNEMQELLGAPIDINQISEEVRQRPILLKLEEVTVDDILKHLTAAGGLRFTIEGNLMIFTEAEDSR